MSAYAQERALDRIADVAARGHDVVTFWEEVTELMTPVVPHYMGPCWYTLDPASVLMTSHFNPAMPELPHEWLEVEVRGNDVQNLATVARSQAGYSTLHEATGGEPSRSPRWHANMEMGGDQELIVALRTRSGESWGALGLYREQGEPLFGEDEIGFLRRAASVLGEGARRALLVGEARDPEGPDGPGLVVLSADGEVDSSTPGIERWLSDLPGGDWGAGRLPTAAVAVATRVLGSERAGRSEGVAVARVLSKSGTWVVLHGAPLRGDGEARAAIIVEPAHPARIAPLLMAAYGLTEREQEVTRLVLQGDSTTQIGERLSLSPHTVQDHLKSVFEKTGVRSRRDLVGKVFFAHYEPRLRDNEQRALGGRPLRGGPYPTPQQGCPGA